MAIKDLFRKKVDPNTLAQQSTGGMAITFNRLPDHYCADFAKMTAITDQRIIARITDTIPQLAQAGLQAKVAARYGGKALYEAILPAGADLKPHLKAGKDMFYGSGKAANGKSIMPDFYKTGTLSGAAQVTAAAMNIASVVVGQYYMSQIDGELKAIKGTMQKLVDFQMDEYRSTIQALLNQVNKITGHQTEVLLNNELRSRTLITLDQCERECDRLLGQAQQALQRLSQTKPADYSQYEEKTKEAYEWYAYQQILLNLQYQICTLAYTLMFGTVPQDFCFETYSTEMKNTQMVCSALCDWHEKQISSHGIDMDELTRKRKGVDALLHAIPSLIDHKLVQRPIAKETAGMVQIQMNTPENRLAAFESRFEKDAHILYDGENLFYLND